MTTKDDDNAILLIRCRDQTGLVAAIADFIWRNGGNIVHADQYTDEQEGMFFQRVAFRLEHFRLSRERPTGALARSPPARYELVGAVLRRGTPGGGCWLPANPTAWSTC